jgi:hypothetical protein
MHMYIDSGYVSPQFPGPETPLAFCGDFPVRWTDKEPGTALGKLTKKCQTKTGQAYFVPEWHAIIGTHCYEHTKTVSVTRQPQRLAQ